jgi:predicted amidohydrolase
MSEAKIPVEEMQRLIAGELSLPARVAYTALLLVALAMTVVVGSLWLTEPSLPARTQASFAVLAAIGTAWVGYAVWVLTRRRVLLAGHRIIAARMAVAFTTVFAAGSLVLAIWGSAGRAAYGAAGTGVVMLAVAIGMLLSSRRRFEGLMQRRRALEAELARSK